MKMKTQANQDALQILNKVPEVTIYFWIIKIMATTVGETAADFLSFNLHLGLTITSILMSFFLLIALLIQVRAKKYVPWIYWIAVVLISVVVHSLPTISSIILVFAFKQPLSFSAWLCLRHL